MLTFLSIITVLLFSIISLIFLWLFLLLARACLRVIFGGKIFSTLEPKAVILALGITAILFKETFDVIIEGPIMIMIVTLKQFAQSISYLLSDKRFNEDTMLDYAVNDLDLVNTIAGQLQNILYSVSIAHIAIALAVFLLIANAISEGGDSSLILKVRNWFANLSTLARQRLILGVTLLLGGYLSLAAIIAIPWLEGFEKVGINEEAELQQRILQIFGDQKEFEQRWGEEIIKTDPFKELRKTIEQFSKDTSPNTQTASEHDTTNSEEIDNTNDAAFTQSITNITNYIGEADQDIRSLRTEWISIKTRANEQRDKTRQIAIDTYSRYKDTQLSERERELFRDDLVRWVRRVLDRLDSDLRSYRSNVLWQENDWTQWASYMESELFLSRSENRIPGNWFPSRNFNTLTSLADNFYNQNWEQPPSPRDVSGLGVFGFFANWLVERRSFSLALISGMVGFGLFGSIMSRALIRYSGNAENKDTDITLDVVLVGLSSAIIIFLASQGGLAVFTSGELRPNAYILFLACFIGAAYGDHVWNTAKDRFLKSLDNENVNDKPGKSDGGELKDSST